MHAHVHQLGVTLIELMITVAVAAVLLMIAVPGFRDITLANKLDTTANGIVNAIQVARMEAIKRSTSTQLCSGKASVDGSDTLGKACGTEVGAVWAMRGNQPSRVLAGVTGISAPVELGGDLVALRFSPQGFARKPAGGAPYSGAVADLRTCRLARDNHRIVSMTAGSVLATTTKSGACP